MITLSLKRLCSVYFVELLAMYVTYDFKIMQVTRSSVFCVVFCFFGKQIGNRTLKNVLHFLLEQVKPEILML